MGGEFLSVLLRDSFIASFITLERIGTDKNKYINKFICKELINNTLYV